MTRQKIEISSLKFKPFKSNQELDTFLEGVQITGADMIDFPHTHSVFLYIRRLNGEEGLLAIDLDEMSEVDWLALLEISDTILSVSYSPLPPE